MIKGGAERKEIEDETERRLRRGSTTNVQRERRALRVGNYRCPKTERGILITIMVGYSLRARRLIYLHRPITPRVNYLYIHCFTGKKGIRSFQLYIGLNLFSRLWLPDVRLHASDGDRQTQPMAFILPAVPSLEDLLHASASTMAEPRNTMSLAKITQKHKD
jgi:hypothetical protein